ncbi:TIGR03086 family metal-binding protein [Actinomadura sp. WMMB 499]|uniref:TIGR03086 family metal-binding protein n=1 Tax=Actinomadura sp. WMMB 499 TaxID=1219491 RepID=UPI0012450078|nr:TIGR03086 family metal-binding protein [Actinomadura sp. WMMB 499]QFG23434.1 TIGR03086 family protein [Actinomadura sp. WMMB 499]
MTPTIDHGPAARRLAGLLAAIPDSALAVPTPCADMDLATLLDHVHGLADAFTRAATKDWPEGSSAPDSDGSRLPADWRARIPAALDGLAAAWRDPAAWEGMTEAGGVELPGEAAGHVALNEIVVHGWDVARATGQPYEAGTDEVEACLAFVGPAVEESGGAAIEGLFGPAVPVPDGTAPLDRLIAMTGRDPSWTPAYTPPARRAPAT